MGRLMDKLEYAEKFLSMGIDVFAIQVHSKKPYWPYAPNGFHNATNDIGVIKNWLRESPEINIGGAIPKNLVVLDIDKPYIFDELELIVPETFTVKTHKGFHYYFKDPIGFSRRTQVEKCMDFLKNGYIILPPSVHPKGTQYSIINDSSISDPPLWMIEFEFFFKQKNKSNENTLLISQNETIPNTDLIPIGKRNVTLFWFGMNLRANGVSAERIKISVKKESLRCEGDFSDKELLGIINSINRYKRDEAMNMVSRGEDYMLHRERPFTYCMMKTLDLFEENYDGQDLVKIKAIWLTICEIFDRTGNIKSITTFNQSISFFSGLSKNQVSVWLRELKKLDLIEVTNPQKKMENGQYRFTGKTIRLKEGF